jgi:hypothetical protein
MASKEKYKGTIIREAHAVPFENVEEMWFWFIAAQQARQDGARLVSGQSVVSRPCEAVDILKVVDGLYRKRRLLREHLLVLRHYGLRNFPPDSRRVREVRASVLWGQAMERLEEPMIRKGIVREQGWAEKLVRTSQVYTLDTERMAAE